MGNNGTSQQSKPQTETKSTNQSEQNTNQWSSPAQNQDFLLSNNTSTTSNLGTN